MPEFLTALSRCEIGHLLCKMDTTAAKLESWVGQSEMHLNALAAHDIIEAMTIRLGHMDNPDEPFFADALLTGRTEAEQERGDCPSCSGKLIPLIDDVPERGFVVVWTCRKAVGDNPQCDYRKTF